MRLKSRDLQFNVNATHVHSQEFFLSCQLSKHQVLRSGFVFASFYPEKYNFLSI